MKKSLFGMRSNHFTDNQHSDSSQMQGETFSLNH